MAHDCTSLVGAYLASGTLHHRVGHDVATSSQSQRSHAAFVHAKISRIIRASGLSLGTTTLGKMEHGASAKDFASRLLQGEAIGPYQYQAQASMKQIAPIITSGVSHDGMWRRKMLHPGPHCSDTVRTLCEIYVELVGEALLRAHMEASGETKEGLDIMGTLKLFEILQGEVQTLSGLVSNARDFSLCRFCRPIIVSDSEFAIISGLTDIDPSALAFSSDEIHYVTKGWLASH